MMPWHDDSLLQKHLGLEAANKLLPVIKSLKQDYDSSDACHMAVSLPEMGKIASEQFRKKHPEIPNEIVRAFEWCYTYANR